MNVIGFNSEFFVFVEKAIFEKKPVAIQFSFLELTKTEISESIQDILRNVETKNQKKNTTNKFSIDKLRIEKLKKAPYLAIICWFIV